MADVLFRTSGSTGSAKTIVRSAEALDADARHLVAIFPALWSSHPHVVTTVRTEHFYGALWVARAPRFASCAVHEEPLASVEELAALAECGNLLLVTTPSFLAGALEHVDFARLKGAFCDIVTSGSPLAAETARAVEAVLGIAPLEIYGSTETGTIAFRRRSERDDWTLVSDVTATATPEGLIRVDSPFAEPSPYVLNDRVSFSDARHFTLLGRADRLVKILEHAVSLTRVEEVLATHPHVRQARVEVVVSGGIARLGALIVPNARGVDALVQKPSAAFSKSLRTHLQNVLNALSLPRRFRYVRVLPTNPQGKTTAEAVRNALNAWCNEPVVRAWSIAADVLTANLTFPPDMTCFSGHFPDHPILPGVAQLYFVRHFARQVFPDFPDVCSYRKLKFRKVVLPGSTLPLTVTRKAAGRFAFTLGDAASGEVIA